MVATLLAGDPQFCRSVYAVNPAEQESNEKTRIDPDRPHLPEASTAVGKGHFVLESGYTFNEKGFTSFSSHSYPEALLRIGAFSDRFEFRIGQNFLNQQQTVTGVGATTPGADLYLGAKLAVTQQHRYRPEIAIIPQALVPTGSSDVNSSRVLPGVNVDCSWEIVKDRFSLETVTATNRVVDDPHRSHTEIATGLTNVFQLSRKLEAFAEWDAFYPIDTTDPAGGAKHYAVGGFVLFVTKNLAIDIRTGIGLTENANHFLIGTGFAFRH